MPNKTDTSAKIQKLIIYFLLATVTLVVYWQVNQFDFISLDDGRYVTQNIHIRSGITLEGCRWAFTTFYFYSWNPLLWLSFMFDYQIYGLHAGGYHMTNVILHILSTLMLFWLFTRMTKELWKSAFIAAFFALHPLHVESVVWVSERKDVLSAFFWMLTLCLYVYYTEKPNIKKYLLVLFSFMSALMSKPTIITLPLIMILLDYWPLKRLKSQKNWISWQLKEKLPFIILSVVITFLTFYTIRDSYAKPYKHLTFQSRLANAPVSFVTYLEKTFWPHDMAIFYPFSFNIPLWQVIGSIFMIIVISVFVIIMAKRIPYLFVGWMWFSITIAPVIGIVHQLSAYSMADHYHYLPSIGIGVMLAWGMPLLFKNKRGFNKILFSMGVVFLAFLMVLTWQQCRY